MSNEQSSIATEHPDVVDDIDAMYAEVFGGDEDDIDDLSDDAAMQVIRDASERCGMAGIPREERVDVIIAGQRQFLHRSIEEDLQETRYMLEMLFQI